MPTPLIKAAVEGQDVAARVEQLRAMLYLVNGRVAELEVSNAELRARLDMDPPAPSIGVDWMTIKQVSIDTGYAESTVRSWIASGKIEARAIGGKVLINAASLPRREFAR